MTQDIILAIDAGGSSTVAVAVTTAGSIVGRAVSGPGNHVLSPIEVVRRSFEDAIVNTMEEAGVTEDDLLLITGDTAGIGSNREGAEFVENIVSDLFPKPEVFLIGDMVASFYGSMPLAYNQSGIVAIAGTGSVFYGKTRAGKTLQVGGWGHIMGDEGSAYDIAVKGLRAAAKAYDKRGPATSLSSVIPKHFAVENMFLVQIPIYLGAAISLEEISGAEKNIEYGQQLSRDKIARIAVIVAEEAKNGDVVAREILRKAGADLALGVLTVGGELGVERDEMQVSYTGGVFKAGNDIIGPFTDIIQREEPRANIREPLMPTIGGGVIAGLDHMGIDFHEILDTLVREFAGSS
ncbi:MAG: hypothetical protein GY866_39500 [Proteobacteria bacterium]|nr:hypothetical protein [Pseudomonadota bacterium]